MTISVVLVKYTRQERLEGFRKCPLTVPINARLALTLTAYPNGGYETILCGDISDYFSIKA